jgi:octaprenyl-diphosphate synthase
METVQPTSSTGRLNQLLAPVQTELDAVENWLETALTGENPRLSPLLDHLKKFRGKRVRAAQILLIAKGCGGFKEVHIPVAGIVEMIHSATLVHDDLLDEASQRRALDCVHVEWGSHSAVLLGDWIYAKAFEECTKLPGNEASVALATATRRVCAGEIYQNLTRKNFDLSEASYLEQIDGKTGALFEEGARLAGFFAGASPEIQAACGAYGKLTGRAFQIADDILDLVGDEKRVGKSLGTDWDRGKMTFPLIRLRDILPQELQVEIRGHFGKNSDRSILMEPKFSSYLEQALQESHQEIQSLLQRACDAITCLPFSESRKPLIALTHFLGSRNR